MASIRFTDVQSRPTEFLGFPQFRNNNDNHFIIARLLREPLVGKSFTVKDCLLPHAGGHSPLCYPQYGYPFAPPRPGHPRPSPPRIGTGRSETSAARTAHINVGLILDSRVVIGQIWRNRL